jgi:penicillin-binding protein activator
VTDLSGRWNDTDSRLVANELIGSSLTGAVAAPAHGVRRRRGAGGHRRLVPQPHHGAHPGEHVRADLERAYITSGAVRVVAVAGRAAGGARRAADQQENASAATRARMAQETGARYMLQGNIEAIEDREGRERVIFYQVDATLVDLQSNERVWAGQKQIKKLITQPRFGR